MARFKEIVFVAGACVTHRVRSTGGYNERERSDGSQVMFSDQDKVILKNYLEKGYVVIRVVQAKRPDHFGTATMLMLGLPAEEK